MSKTLLTLGLCLLPLAVAGEPLRDPTEPPMPEVVDEEPLIIEDELVLSFTRTAVGQRLAIINGRPYRIGERIGAARIRAIRPGEVELVDTESGEPRTIRIPATAVKSAPETQRHGLANP